jgi:ketosteroid isomerase-like protein
MAAAEIHRRPPRTPSRSEDCDSRRGDILASLVLALALATPCLAGEAESPGPEACVDRFHAALEAGDRPGALAELAPEVVIFEQGGAELSRQEYAAHHLEDDVSYLRATETRIVDRRTGGDGGTAWVLTRSETTGTFEGKPVATSGTETMVLERRPEGWRIVHVHWSSRRRTN